MTVLVAKDPSMGLVIGMGLGIVFVGLISIILICYLMGFIIKSLEDRKPVAVTNAAPAAPIASADPIENKGELVAVVSAVIAEELGESVEAIRIKSIRKVS